MNQLRDFRLYRYQKGPQKGQESMWLFRIGRCDEAKHVVDTLRKLPEWERHYYVDEDHLWAVRPTPANQRLLARLFANFAAELEMARRQPELPLLGRVPVDRPLPWTLSEAQS